MARKRQRWSHVKPDVVPDEHTWFWYCPVCKELRVNRRCWVCGGLCTRRALLTTHGQSQPVLGLY